MLEDASHFFMCYRVTVFWSPLFPLLVGPLHPFAFLSIPCFLIFPNLIFSVSELLPFRMFVHPLACLGLCNGHLWPNLLPIGS